MLLIMMPLLPLLLKLPSPDASAPCAAARDAAAPDAAASNAAAADDADVAAPGNLFMKFR